MPNYVNTVNRYCVYV